MKISKKRIMIDLDGVLNQYKGKFDKNFIPPTKEGAKEFVKKLSQTYELKLFTSRNCNLAQNWLKDNDLEEYFSAVTNIKEPCYLIVDDRCVKFCGNYDETLKTINKFDTW